jgi:nucleotide-binding universal stress UspA family protein
MTNLHRILVPVDFSENSAPAARYAACLCLEAPCELHLLHVMTPRPLDFALLDPPESLRRELAAERTRQVLAMLQKFRTQLREDVDVRLRVAEGDAAEEIARYADTAQMDAVVIPTRGQSRVERLLLIGSVTMKVLHAIERPVFTGANFDDHMPPRSIRRVLCAVDLGPSSERVLCAGLSLAKRFGAALSLVNAQAVFGGHAREIYDESWRDTVKLRAQAKLEALVAKLDIDADVHVEFEQPPRAISGMALELGADLVVLGRGESDNLIGRLRADAYDIIRLCHCPVVSV